MTIHAEHPFLEPPERRRAVRRLRARWPSGVSIWTAYGRRPVGLTISSMLIADGEPGEVVALIDPDADLTDALAATRRGTISLLSATQAPIADVFAGLTPAPGGPFTVGTWRDHAGGPWLEQAIAVLAVEISDIDQTRGWSRLVTGRIGEIVAAPRDDPALTHVHGRYGAVDLH